QVWLDPIDFDARQSRGLQETGRGDQRKHYVIERASVHGPVSVSSTGAASSDTSPASPGAPSRTSTGASAGTASLSAPSAGASASNGFSASASGATSGTSNSGTSSSGSKFVTTMTNSKRGKSTVGRTTA